MSVKIVPDFHYMCMVQDLPSKRMGLAYRFLSIGNIAMATYNNIGIGPTGFPVKTLKHLGLCPVIRVNESYVVTMSMRNAGVPGGTKSRVVLMDAYDIVVCIRILICDCSTAIRRAVIDKDDFYILQSLSEKAIDTLPQISFYVVYRNNHANAWHQ
jgi:hypothetical protein